jgi:hypothetical protein
VTKLIYESPKKDRKRSAPIAASDKASRDTLEEKGWRLIQTIEDAPIPEEVTSDESSTPNTPASPNSSQSSEQEPPPAFLETIAALTAEQRTALDNAGLATEDALRSATDDELKSVPKIGPAAVRDIRAALLPQGQPPA